MNTHFDIKQVIQNEIDELELEFTQTLNEGERRKIFFLIEGLYRELDTIKSRG